MKEERGRGGKRRQGKEGKEKKSRVGRRRERERKMFNTTKKVKAFLWSLLIQRSSGKRPSFLLSPTLQWVNASIRW